MKTLFDEEEIPKEAKEEYERIENELLAEEFHTKEKKGKMKKCEASINNNSCGKKARFKIQDIICEFNKDSIFWVCDECVKYFINQKEFEPHYIIIEEK